MVTVAVRLSAAAVVATTGWSGAEIGGTVVGIITAGAAVVALGVSMKTASRARQREYEKELREAHDDGVKETETRLKTEIDRLTDDRNNWRAQAQARWIRGGE